MTEILLAGDMPAFRRGSHQRCRLLTHSIFNEHRHTEPLVSSIAVLL